MEVPVSAQEYVEQGKTLLWQGRLREAAAAFAHAAQSAPNFTGAHLGLAQTSLALGSYGMVYMACRRVQELEQSGPNADLARALLVLLDRRYDRALEAVDRVIAADPGRPYAYALRAYALRQMGREYEAALAEAKSERLAGPTDLQHLFPRVTSPIQPPSMNPGMEEASEPEQHEPARQPPPQLRRQIVRASFATRDRPIVALTLIGINVLVFLLGIVLSRSITNPATPDNPIYAQGIEYGPAILQDHQYWRILTAMFLHLNWLHIGLNMLSLYFIGPFAEHVYGRWRFLLIYFASGIFGGILVLLLAPNVPELGASGAIFGVFGALGTFFWEKRRALGAGFITNWLFWLILNLVFTFGNPSISVAGHIGGLSMGLLLGLLLLSDFWTPVRTRIRRGQTGDALIYMLKPLLLVLAVGAGLIFLAISLGQGR